MYRYADILRKQIDTLIMIYLTLNTWQWKKQKLANWGWIMRVYRPYVISYLFRRTVVIPHYPMYTKEQKHSPVWSEKAILLLHTNVIEAWPVSQALPSGRRECAWVAPHRSLQSSSPGMREILISDWRFFLLFSVLRVYLIPHYTVVKYL